MESDANENLMKTDTGIDGNDKKETIDKKLNDFFLTQLSNLETNSSIKKEDIKDLKRNFHILQLLTEEIKDAHKEKGNKEIKEKESVIKHSKSEINNKITKPIIPVKEVKKPEIGRSKTPVKPVSKPDNRSRTPIPDRNKVTKQDNKTPVRERPNREPIKTPNNNTISKSPVLLKSKTDVKNSSTINIKTIDKKDKKVEEKHSTKKEVNTITKSKSEINDKKSKFEEKSVTSEKTEDSAVHKPIEMKQADPVATQEITVRFNIPKKELSPDDAILTNFESNLIKGLLLTFRSNFLPLRTISTIIINNKNLGLTAFPQLKKMLLKLIIQEKEIKLRNINEVLKKYDNDSNVEGISNKTFTASKTAINSLNLVQKEEEANLLKTSHSDNVLNVFKLMFISLGEDYLSVPTDKLPEKLYNEIIPKHKVEGLKTLMFNVVLKNMDFSKGQIESMIKLVEENQKLLVSSELLKLNKVVSYTSFILKEIYEYQTAKFPDGEYIYIIKEEKKNQKILLQRIQELKKML